MKRPLLIGALIASTCFSYANQPAWSQTFLSDNFSSPPINTNLWNVILPFNGVMIYDWTGHYVVSGASITNGSLVLTGAGQISSKQSFQYPYNFSGVINGGSWPSIYIRGTNNSFDPNYGHPTGYDIQFALNLPSDRTDYQWQIIEQGTLLANHIYRNTNYIVDFTKPVSFSITDYGDEVDTTINGILFDRTSVTNSISGQICIESSWWDNTGVQITSLQVTPVGCGSAEAAAWVSYLSSNLPTNSGFYSSLAANTDFISALATSITSSPSTYGILQQGPQGLQGVQGPIGLTGPQGPQGPQGPVGPTGVFDPTVLTNTAFLTGLASNPVFLNALSAQIQNGSNNFGLAVKQNQTLTFPAIATVTYASNAPKITLSATSSVGLAPVTFTSANGAVATVLSNSLTVVGAGSTTITASQIGNALWNPVSATRSFVVTPITQTLSFPAIPTQQNVAGQKLVLGATSSAKLAPITYSVGNTAIATVSSNMLTVLGAGTTTVTATQSGTQNYTPATATQTLIVK